ncbi:hypothetical protein B0H13DRAFT_2383838 [Mycena leptocephala]|nr:hypothetical protein B0H13DRAFT_2383838 [Mycena leptocephala]
MTDICASRVPPPITAMAPLDHPHSDNPVGKPSPTPIHHRAPAPPNWRGHTTETLPPRQPSPSTQTQRTCTPRVLVPQDHRPDHPAAARESSRAHQVLYAVILPSISDYKVSPAPSIAKPHQMDESLRRRGRLRAPPARYSRHSFVRWARTSSTTAAAYRTPISRTRRPQRRYPPERQTLVSLARPLGTHRPPLPRGLISARKTLVPPKTLASLVHPSVPGKHIDHRSLGA